MKFARLKERFISSIMDNSAELFSVIDASGNYQFVGGSIRNQLGYHPDELVSRSAFEYVHPEDRTLIEAAIGSALFRRTTHLPNFRFRHQNGSWRWLQCRITNMADNPEVRGYITNSIDITERVEVEGHQVRCQAHYESLFHNHPDAVFELDRGGFFTLFNKNFPKLTGYAPEEIKGAHFRELVLEKDLPIAMNTFIRALEGSPHQVELSFVKPDGEAVYLTIAIVPVVLGNDIVKIQGIARDITLQKNLERYADAQARQLHQIMERLPQSFYSLDREWRYTYVNNFYCRYLGVSKKELLGKNIWHMFPGAVNTDFYKTCLQVAQTGIPATAEAKSLYQNDTTIHLQIYPTGEDISVHFVDITEKKKEQDQLEKLSLVASKTNTCILIQNKLGQIEWVNEAFENVTGYTLCEVALRNPTELLTGKETDPKTMNRIRKRVAAGKPFRGEVLNYTKDGREIWFYLEITPVHAENGELVKFISIRTDITQRKAREQELVEATRELFRQNHDLQHFSYMVSHNLRAPAANIMGLSSLMTRVDKKDAMYDQLVQKIKLSAHNLDTVIRDMNHVLSVREQHEDLQREEVYLAKVVEEAIAVMDYKLNRQECRLHIAVAPEIVLCSNKAYLLEIFKNLISNAVKFKQKDKPLVLNIVASKGKRTITIKVSDNGIGMDMQRVGEDLFKIYKRFHVGYQGRGIGLFLVKTYLDILKGKISVTSEPDKGTSFKIQFEVGAR
ncbi:PAS domain S-box protein [Pontibacter sp. BT731]|uniref:PAS domain-containing sensor histidine kinase n=1 Tax=Pontibacter coccineus TaxID=3063328 RepID=UPI0026E2EFCE|nr:PAS domain-containing sensor histidine kinase [Pontibacter sp. BT731]MDO6391415.1 PAS domain S-box protein [Pontibacter sp. BT731]